MSLDLSLYKLADATQLKFSYMDGKVSGHTEAMLVSDFGLEVPVGIKAVKIFSAEQTGILFKLTGDLSMIISHFPKTGMVSAYLLDGGCLTMEGVKAPPELFIGKKMSLREVVQALGHAIVASFYFDQGWKPLRLPS